MYNSKQRYNPEDFSAPLNPDGYPRFYSGKSEYGQPLTDILNHASLNASSALIWTTIPGWKIPKRQRNETYLWIFLEGGGQMEIEGSLPPVSIEPGEAILVPENRSHSLFPCKRISCRVLVFHFLFRYLDALDIFDLLEIEGRIPLRRGSTELGRELCEAYVQRRPGWRQYIEAGLLTMLYPALLQAAHRFKHKDHPFPSLPFRKLVPAFSFIHRNSADPGLTIQDVSNAAGVSQVYLRRLFRTFSGKTPQQFILEKRLHTARDLLIHSEMTIAEIAYKSGFETESYFYRVFKREYKYSPGEYRRNPQV